MTPWQIVFTRQAQKDARRLASAGLRPKAEQLLTVLADDPFRRPPPFEKLAGDLRGAYSRDALVIGGGISGPLLARQLVRKGVDCVPIDRRDIGFGSTSARTALLQYEIDTPLHVLRQRAGGSAIGGRGQQQYREGLPVSAERFSASSMSIARGAGSRCHGSPTARNASSLCTPIASASDGRGSNSPFATASASRRVASTISAWRRFA